MRFLLLQHRFASLILPRPSRRHFCPDGKKTYVIKAEHTTICRHLLREKQAERDKDLYPVPHTLMLGRLERNLNTPPLAPTHHASASLVPQ